MSTATAIVSSVLAAIATLSAIGKLTKHPVIVDDLTEVNVPLTWFPRLAATELAGATGLLIGLVAVPALGIAAAIGLSLYFAGAVGTHIRANHSGLAKPATIMLLAIAAAILQAVTL